ncbi:uncharacterized protein LOC115670045 isoform X2 [Syzygium oleosum]|uniref:uncharacterized protein LOC115670045 isoform X2 n=1 Tax=Syzygium oleosum TaxID=219896 RepID=UPI0024BBACCA|nr:uncharacterized protein LOC115670045 isoform X2 [Syzygium oleosum]
MELRSCIHLHSIQAIKNGQVTKVLNITRGRPALLFKKVADLCGSGDVKDLITFRKFEPKDELDVSDFDDDDDVRGGLYPDTVGRKTTRSNLNCSKFNHVDEKNSLLDDFCLQNMTLNQIKERCKMQKRKRILWEDSSAIDDDSRSPKKEVRSHSLPEEDELDLEEPLIIWKAKMKNFKGKKVSLKKCEDSSCQSAKVVVKAVQIPSPQPTLQSEGNLCMPISVKVEDEAHDCGSNSQTGVGAPRDSLEVVNDGQATSNVTVSSEVPNPANESYQDNQISVGEESEICVLNKVPYEDVEHATLASESSNLDVAISVVNPDGSSCSSQPTKQPCGDGVGMSQDDAGESMLYDHERISTKSIVGDCNSACNANLNPSCGVCLDSPIELEKQCHLCTGDDAEISCTADVPPCDVAEPTKQPCGDGVGMSHHERISKKSIVGDCNSAGNANMNPSCDVCLDSPIKVEKQSHVCTGDDVEISCTTDVPPCDVADDPTTLQMFEKFDQLKLHCAPWRFFSARKVISPTSQERLRKLMGATESNDDCYGSRGKVYSQKQTETESLGVERFKLIRRAELPPNPKRKKLKSNKKGSPPKGNHKDSNLSGTVPRVNSSQSCSQSAIAFSQRQMQDFDNLATKLMTELNVMTDIVEGNSGGDSCLTGNTKYTTDEVKTAIENASKVKETARKWLSMMARDCNRFCKIMRLTEDCHPMTEHKVHKERKKITFADEAGGELCHVKYIEDSMASLLASNNENQEATVE